MAIQLVITDIGRAAVLNAEQNGFAPVRISEIGFGSGQYVADSTQTSLVSEDKRVSALSGGAISPTAIHVTALDDSSDAYQVFEIGAFLNDGTLFAVYSQNTPIIDKAAPSSAMLAVDIELSGDVTPAMLDFGDTNFNLNSATTTHEGLVRLATNSEATAGTNSTTAVTPSALNAARAWASKSQAEAGTASGVVMTPERTKQAIDFIRAFATQSEAQAGVRADVVTSPKTVKDAINSQRPWANDAQAKAGTATGVAMDPLRTMLAISEMVEVGTNWLRVGNVVAEWGKNYTTGGTFIVPMTKIKSYSSYTEPRAFATSTVGASNSTQPLITVNWNNSTKTLRLRHVNIQNPEYSLGLQGDIHWLVISTVTLP